MKKTGNKNLKIAAATMMTIFSLFTCFSGAMAWFLGMRTFDEEMENFEVSSVKGALNKITFHQLNDKHINDSYEESIFYFNKEAVGTLTYDWDNKNFVPTGDTSIRLENYDYLDHEQPLLMIVELNQPLDEKVTISLKTDSENQKFIGERDDDSVPLYDLSDSELIVGTGTISRDGKQVEVNYYGLSNVAKFYSIQYTEESFNENFENEDYYTFTNLSNQKSFVDIDNSGDNSSFSTSISPLIEADATTKYIAVVVDYYADAIEYIYSTYLGDTVLEDTYDSYLYFKCDWSMEVI